MVQTKKQKRIGALERMERGTIHMDKRVKTNPRTPEQREAEIARLKELIARGR